MSEIGTSLLAIAGDVIIVVVAVASAAAAVVAVVDDSSAEFKVNDTKCRF